ncbi:MAG: elongation factor P [Sphingobacteriia bacterium]|nr:elongation factor P [Sphingobacteriia bacterium]
MKISANSIKAGHILEHNGGLYAVTKTPVHTQPGKGGAYVQVEMKNIKTGTKVNERFSSSDDVTKARLETKDYQYLYLQDDKIVLMDQETYEQIEIPAEMLGERIAFLSDGMIVVVEVHNEQPITIKLPETVVCEIVESEPVIKGQTVTSSYKPAKLDNGLRIMVPPFIDVGTKVVVRTEDVTYVERAK